MNAQRTDAAHFQSPAREMLEHTVTILLGIGHSKQALLEELQDILSERKDSERSFDPAQVQTIAGYSHVLAHWYADPDFRDRRFPDRPAALPLNGSKRSLAALIRRVFPKRRVPAIVDALLALGAIRRHGRLYVPCARHVSFASDPSMAHLHAYMSLLGQMRTVAHNLACTRGDELLFERAATNASVPIGALPTIHRHIRRVLADVLFRIDAYLSRWEVREGSEPTTLVGAGAFVFDNYTTRRSTANPSSRGKSRAIRGSRHD